MTTSGSHVQEFNTLILSGSGTWTDNSTIANWYAQRSETGSTIAAGTGSANAGNLYSYGATLDSDRALGSLGSTAAGNFAYGVLLRNTSGGTITDIRVSYVGEQWRNSGVAAQTASFHYRTATTPITALNPNANGAWTAVAALNFTSPITGGTAGALNGNLAVNRVAFSDVAIPSLSLANNDYIMLKWDDPDHTGADHGLSIDDVLIEWTVAGAPTTSVNFASATSSIGEDGGTIDLTLSITNPSTTNATEVDVVLTNGDGARINGYTTQTLTWAANDAADQTVTITITDNGLCDGDEELTFELQNVTGGDDAEIGDDNEHVLTVVDDDGGTIDPPVATAATDVTIDSFTANWEAVAGATGYYLDVYTLGDTEASDLFISEYVEGSSNNKYIEIYNGTGSAVDLSDYAIRIYANGGASPANTIALTGTLAHGEVHVLAHNSAALAVTPDQTSGSLTFNGNDAVELYNTATTSAVDIFGRIGEDPGTAWTDGAHTTVDHTLVRKSTVTGGITANPAGGFPTLASEWDVYPNNTADYLGSHTYAPGGSVNYLPGYENLSVGNVLEYEVTGLAPNTTYYYVVRAANACATSDDSNEEEVTTEPLIIAELFADPTSLNFGAVAENTTSTTLELAISGTDLDPASGSIGVEVSPGLEVEISLDEVDWDTYLEVPYTGGTMSATVYVRFSPTSIGVQNGTITLSGGSADDVVVTVTGTGAEAQIYWNFQTETPTVDLIPNTSTSAISRGQDNSTAGALVNASSPSSGYLGASGNNNAAVSAWPAPFNAATSSYFAFTVTTAAGYFTDFHTFNFGSRSTNSGPQAYSVRWSVDGYASDLITGTLSNNSTWALQANTGISIITPVGEAVTFRIYGHDGTGGTGTAANWRIDDLDLRGDSYEAADTYYSRATGTVAEPIWSDTPTGTAGPASFGAGISMVVQTGDVVTATASVAVNNVEVESGATLELNDGTTFSIHGDATFDGDVVANESEIALVGADGVVLQSASALDLYDLTVNTPNGALTDAVISIRGTLQLTDGEFESNAPITLVSDVNGTGRLGPVGAAATYVGDLTVQRYIPDGATNWRLLGSPVANKTVGSWMDDFFTAGFPGSHWPPFYDTWHGGYEEGANYWPSIRLYDETTDTVDVAGGLVGVESQLTPLTFGRGYAAWSGDNLGGTAPFTVDVSGVPHIAKTPAALPTSYTVVTPPTPPAQGWNLVANPLASPIAWSGLAKGADVVDGYYVYDPATGNTAYWDEAGQESTPSGVLNGVIQSSQGFWVKADGPLATVTVDEGAKVADQEGGLFGGDLMGTMAQVRLLIGHAANALSDEARVVFSAGAPGYGQGDAFKLPVGHQHAPRIATRSAEGYDLMVNKYGAYSGAVSVPVTIRAAIDGVHTITVYTEHVGLSCLALEDLETGTITPLTNGTEYTFEQTSTDNAAIARFVLHASAPIPFTASNGVCGATSGSAQVELGDATAPVTLSTATGDVLQHLEAATGTVVFGQLATGNYTVSVGSQTVCATLAQDFTIVATGTAVVVAMEAPSFAAVDEQLEFNATATEGAELAWDFGDGSVAYGDHAVHAYAYTGTYTVTLFATLDDCEVITTGTVEVSHSTGVQTLTTGSLNVWYNGGQFVVDHVYDHSGQLLIEVLDATGRLHATAHSAARPGRVLVPAEGLNTGIWFVRITSQTDQRTVRVPLTR